MDREALWATVHRVAKSQTQLKWLKSAQHIYMLGTQHLQHMYMYQPVEPHNHPTKPPHSYDADKETKTTRFKDFPGGPVAKTVGSQCRAHGAKSEKYINK